MLPGNLILWPVAIAVSITDAVSLSKSRKTQSRLFDNDTRMRQIKSEYSDWFYQFYQPKMNELSSNYPGGPNVQGNQFYDNFQNQTNSDAFQGNFNEFGNTDTFQGSFNESGNTDAFSSDKLLQNNASSEILNNPVFSPPAATPEKEMLQSK